jgi:hypothetical protein
LIVSRHFIIRQKYNLPDHLVKDEKGFISYGRGQPMGFYSSWAIFSLTHHIFINYCNFLCKGKRTRTNEYSLIGDDVSIFNSALAVKYQEQINLIGTKLQLEKSVVNTNTGTQILEFTKRLVSDGREITPLKYNV